MATEVLVPPLGQTVDTVTLVSWYKEEGEPVAQGEMLFAIETDKATLDVEAPASGVLCRVAVLPGDEVKALSSIALIAAPDEVWDVAVFTPAPEPYLDGAEGPVLSSSASLAVDSVEGPGPRGEELAPAPGQNGGDGRGQGVRRRLFISPRARRLAEEHRVPL
jgi:pyruvate dehydrogenase E2 component (dihydrolipoamide acetyltransferase)